jgi:hypothetical protein
MKPTDALNSNFIGIVTLHVSVSLSTHLMTVCGSKLSSNLQKCTNAYVRLRTPDDGQKDCPKHAES